MKSTVVLEGVNAQSYKSILGHLTTILIVLPLKTWGLDTNFIKIGPPEQSYKQKTLCSLALPPKIG